MENVPADMRLPANGNREKESARGSREWESDSEMEDHANKRREGIRERLQREKMLRLETGSPEETFLLGKRLGEEALPGEVYTLVGDLGAGKTVFTQGFAAGLGVTEQVSSPTFTIVQIYEEGRMPFYHFDVYRIGDVEEMEEIGYEDCFYGEGVSMIEWANLIQEILPSHYTGVTIERDPEKGFDYRRILLEEK